MDIHKNDFTLVRVEKRTFKERDFIDIRQYYKNNSGEFKPTTKGVTIPPELLPELIEALEKMHTEDALIDE